MLKITNDYPEPNYIEIVCEARLNPTEKKSTIEVLLQDFIEGSPSIDERFDGTYLVIRASSEDALQILGDWIRQQQILDTVRDRLIRSITGNITALYFNRQAAAMGRLALVDINDNPPNGPIVLQIVSDGLMTIINRFTPKTWKGKELTSKEWERFQRREQRIREKKEREKKRKNEMKEKYRS